MINSSIVTVLGKIDRLARKKKSFLLLCYFLCKAKMPPSKFEAILMLCLRVRHTSFSISVSCLKDYFCTYAIIDVLTNWSVFPNAVNIIVLALIKSIDQG